MISELKKSINSILYERVTSPLFGTFIVTWTIWNWKIIYLTFFVSEKKIDETKIKFIVNNYSDFNLLILYPIISTILLLTIAPFFTNGAYWLHLKFYKWRTDKKHEIEMSQLLTIEQSIQLRSELAKKETMFEDLLSGKNSEIEQLKLQLEVLKKTEQTSATLQKKKSASKPQKQNQTISRNDMVQKIITNDELNGSVDKLAQYIQGGFNTSGDISIPILGFFESNLLINSKGNGVYEFTDLGKEVYREILNHRF